MCSSDLIRSGDTLFGLASRYAEFTFAQLLNANPDINEDTILQIDQELNLPNCENGRYVGEEEIVRVEATATSVPPTNTPVQPTTTAPDEDVTTPGAATARPTITVPTITVESTLAPDAELGEGECLYVVRRGDTLSTIATRFGIFIRDIAELNDIANVNRISEGQELIIPDQETCP